MSDTNTQTQLPTTQVEFIKEPLSENDLNDLCDATDSAIKERGGFGWIDIPPRDNLERYWQGVVMAPTRDLLVARLDGVISGGCQVLLPPSMNEAQCHMVTLTTNFVAPWAKGYGLYRSLLEETEKHCRDNGYAVINLDVRETMDDSIRLYESMGYQQFGSHPFAVCVKGQAVQSRFYYKLINPNYFNN